MAYKAFWSSVVGSLLEHAVNASMDTMISSALISLRILFLSVTVYYFDIYYLTVAVYA
jgi:hypothetical protein